MKTLKLFLSIICYTGTGFVYLDEQLNGAIIQELQVSRGLQKTIVYLLIVFWVIKIIWFVWDKFYLETRERLKKLNENNK